MITPRKQPNHTRVLGVALLATALSGCIVERCEYRERMVDEQDAVEQAVDQPDANVPVPETPREPPREPQP